MIAAASERLAGAGGHFEEEAVVTFLRSPTESRRWLSSGRAGGSGDCWSRCKRARSPSFFHAASEA